MVASSSAAKEDVFGVQCATSGRAGSALRAQWGAQGTVLLQSSRSLPLTRHELALCHMRTRSIRS